MVRAKFKVTGIRRTMGHVGYQKAEVWTVEMYPVSGKPGEESENSRFWAATPSGKLELGCVNAAAVAQFDLDKEFYVDFTPAD